MESIRGTFLSNFYESKLVYKGLAFRNAEAAYQASKCKYPERKEKFCNVAGWEAKELGKTVELRSDWNEVKLRTMYEVVSAKFAQNPDLWQMLADTGDEEIVEGNYWNDTYWGVCNGVGENHLGKILMWIRNEIRGIDNVPN